MFARSLPLAQSDPDVWAAIAAEPGIPGPLSPPGDLPALADAIRQRTGADALAFFDAIAPVIHADSINMDIAFAASRYDKGGDDYVNCPMDETQYNAFYDALMAAEKLARENERLKAELQELEDKAQGPLARTIESLGEEDDPSALASAIRV